ncbi:MAG: VanZ family protein [Clostridiales bacterium]|nr:VanZ family protein [Clostridiales bacterium]
MKITLYRIILIIFAVASLAFITYNSLQTAEQSTEMSNGVSTVIAEVIVPDFDKMNEPQKQEVVTKISIPVREIAHALEFASLAFFIALFAFTLPFQYGRYPVAMVITLLFGFAFALFDEWIQSFVSGRGTQWVDVWVDCSGVIAGIIFALVVDIIGMGVVVRRRQRKRFR